MRLIVLLFMIISFTHTRYNLKDNYTLYILYMYKFAASKCTIIIAYNYCLHSRYDGVNCFIHTIKSRTAVLSYHIKWFRIVIGKFSSKFGYITTESIISISQGTGGIYDGCCSHSIGTHFSICFQLHILHC